MNSRLRTRIALCAVLLLHVMSGAPEMMAQTFRVSSIDPADGAFNVPTHDTVTVRFTRELSIENDWNAVFRRDPDAAFDSVRLTIGDINTLRTDVIFYEVFQDPSTDFVWFMVGMRDDAGNLLAPTVFSYSTASDRGTRQVSGQVAVDELGKTGLARDLPRAFWRRVRDYVVEGQKAPSLQTSDPVSAAPWPSAESLRLETPDRVIVFLADRNIFQSPDWAVAAADVTDGSGVFTIPYVRDGTYWPVAVKDLDDGGEPFEALGFYDQDGDGNPDPITVSGGNVGGIDISLLSFLPQTAETGFASAEALASQLASDQRLVWILTPSVQDDGKSIEWYYNFHSPNDTLFTAVHSQGFYVSAITEPAIQRTADMLTVPDPFVDSDAALGIADANGGDDFAAMYPGHFTTHNMKGGNFFWQTPRNLDDTYWEVTYAVRPAGVLQTLDVFVDMASGSVIVPSGVSSEEIGVSRFSLSAAYPNPFQAETQISFELGQPSHAVLRVFDALGREVAVLVDDGLHAGPHSVVWNGAEVPSGLYLYRLEAGGRTASGTIMRVR